MDEARSTLFLKEYQQEFMFNEDASESIATAVRPTGMYEYMFEFLLVVDNPDHYCFKI